MRRVVGSSGNRSVGRSNEAQKDVTGSEKVLLEKNTYRQEEKPQRRAILNVGSVQKLREWRTDSLRLTGVPKGFGKERRTGEPSN